jgi:hypothetical protein
MPVQSELMITEKSNSELTDLLTFQEKYITAESPKRSDEVPKSSVQESESVSITIQTKLQSSDTKQVETLVRTETEVPPKKEIAPLHSFHQNHRVLTKKKSNYHLAKPFHLEGFEPEAHIAERLQTVEVLQTSTFNDEKDMSPQSRVMFKVS